MKKYFVYFMFVCVCLMVAREVFAGACVVTSEADSTSKASTLRSKIEKVIYNNGNGGCVMDNGAADKQATVDGETIKQYIAFQTAETNPSDGNAIANIVLDNKLGPLKLKPLKPVIIGNSSEAAIMCTDCDVVYDTDNKNYVLDENGEIKDYGVVTIDASALTKTTASKGEEETTTNTALPFVCENKASAVVLRNLVINLSVDATEAEVWALPCIKYGGNVSFTGGGSGTIVIPVPEDNDADDDGYDSENSGGTDCDDTDASVYPSAAEQCDGIDNDCDGSVDEDVTTTYYVDADADGYGDVANSTAACSAPEGYVADNTDCDDTNAAINSAATETCDEIDNNCDGSVDEGVTTTYYLDADADSYGDASNSTGSCSVPEGYVTDNTDCDDSSNLSYPSNVEVCGDGIDQDCDGSDSVCSIDADLDGSTSDVDCDDANATVYPGATELCDGIDNDCDGAAEGSFDVTSVDGITQSIAGTLDSDYDGLSNAAEYNLFYTDPLLADTDIDETLDGDEIIELYPEWVMGEMLCEEINIDASVDVAATPTICNAALTGCTVTTESCNDVVDNDDDGVVDCLDPDCYGVVYDEASGLSCPVLEITTETSDAGGCKCNLGATGTMNFSTLILSLMVGLGVIAARFKIHNSKFRIQN